jgi:hypothetical protein
MKKLSLLAIFVLVAGAFRADAQSLQNTAWKTYVSGLNDTLTLHIGTDSSFVSTGSGDVVIRSVVQVSADTVSMRDVDGQYACTNGTGIYKYSIKEDKLVMKMVTDPCDNRSGAIDGITWDRAKTKENH